MASIRTAGRTKDLGDLRAVNEIDLDLPEGGSFQPLPAFWRHCNAASHHYLGAEADAVTLRERVVDPR